MQNLGDKIKTLREKKGYSQTEFSEVIGVSRQSISKWENNETTPDAYNLKSIANFFRISLDELLEVKHHSDKVIISPIHKRLSTLSIILYIAMMSFLVYLIIFIWKDSPSIVIDSDGGFSTTNMNRYFSLSKILLFTTICIIPLFLILLYRKYLNKNPLKLDNMLIIVILLILTNPVLGIIHVISLVILYNEIKKYNTQ